MIRLMTIDDIDQVVRLEKLVFNETLGDVFLYNEISINPLSKYYVYEENEQVVSYIGLRIYDNEAEVMNFLVDPNYRNEGYGTKIMNYVLNDLEAMKVDSITLEVRKSNKVAQNFYYKNGFSKISVKKNYYANNEDAYFLKKEV